MKGSRSSWFALGVVVLVLVVWTSSGESKKVDLAPPPPALNYRPIVGVLTQPTAEDLAPYGDSYIDADYVKWLEFSGARVVPIPYDASPALLSELFSYVNGLLYTGGELYLGYNNTYYNASLFLWEMALAAQKDGDYFPVWGTCQGFQLISVMASQTNETVLQEYVFDSENLSLALKLTSPTVTTGSKLFSSLGPEVTQVLSTWNVTMNLHHSGVSPVEFQEVGGNPGLSSFFNLLSTNLDRRGRPFASTIEAKNTELHPIWAVQWHPERNAFEWDLEETELNHTLRAVEAMQALSSFFVSQTRLNSLHRFPNFNLEQRSLIYNWPTVFSLVLESFYPDLQTYVFTDLPQYFENLLGEYSS